METILTLAVLYLIGVSLYTIAVRNNPINKNAPDFDYWSVLKDGMKGMAIGFLIIAIIIKLLSIILTMIHVG